MTNTVDVGPTYGVVSVRGAAAKLGVGGQETSVYDVGKGTGACRRIIDVAG